METKDSKQGQHGHETPPPSSPTPIPSTASLSSSPTTNDDDDSLSRPPSRGSRSLNDDIYPYEAISRALTGDSNRDAPNALTYTRSAASAGSTASRPPDYEVTFTPDDPEDPRNWPLWYRAYVLVVLSYTCWVIVLYSTSYTASIPGLEDEFGVDTSIATLGLTTYLLGLAAGSLVAAPLSEIFGRHPVYLVSATVSALLILPCALATSLTQMIIVRFFG